MDFKGDKKSKGKQVDYYGDHSNFNHNLIEYIQEKGNWRNFHYEKEFSNEGNIAFAETINSLISISYPDKVLPQS